MRRSISAGFCLLVLPLALAAAPAADIQPQRATVAVMSLKSASGITSEDAELLSDRLRIELFNTGKFTVMERSQMQEILKEQGFQQSGACTDEGCMVELGKLLGVQQLIGGSIGKLGSMYLVNLRCIDVKTAKIVAVVSEDVKGGIEDVVGILAATAQKLAGGGQSAARAPQTTSTPPRQNSPEPRPEAAPSPGSQSKAGGRCHEKAYLENAHFTSTDIDTETSPKDLEDMNGNITDALKDALNECLYKDVNSISPQELSALPSCKAIIIRFSADKFTTEPGSRGQVYGTVTATFSFFDGTDASQPFHQETITKKGRQHWGKATPFKNAFEEIASALKDQDHSSYMGDVRKRIRKLP
jgi:TolB-like protein